jgi:hypothetical protein
VAFKKEASWGTYLAGDIYLRAASEGIENQITHVEDEALVKEIYPTEMVKVGESAAGPIDGALHGDTAGILIHGVLGGESAVSNPIIGNVIVNYSGTALYARLTKSGTTLTAETSADGSSWVGDANFGASTGIDISSSAYDTLTELQAAIDGFTGWSATLFGSGTGASSNIADFAATQVFNNDLSVGAKVLSDAYSGSTTAKLHTLYPADSSVSLPSFSFTVNRVLGSNKSVGYVGCKFQSVAISIAANDLVKVSIGVDGKAEEADKNDLSLTLPTIQAFTASNVKILMVKNNGTQIDFDEVKDLSLTINSGIDDNRVVGSIYKQEQVRQKSTIDLSFNANNTSTQYAARTAFTNGDHVELFIYMKSNTYCDSTNSIPYSMLVRVPAITLTNYNSPLSTADRLVITAAGNVVRPKSTVYPKHVYFYINDADTTVY